MKKSHVLALTASSLFLTGLVVGRTSYTDRLAGKAAFRIQRQGEDVVMQPILTPFFKLSVLKGPRPVEGGVVQCSVWGRELRRDATEGQVIVITILRCGETEYGLAEVDFAFGDKRDDKALDEKLSPSTMPQQQ